jgi:hypothetical protein
MTQQIIDKLTYHLQSRLGLNKDDSQVIADALADCILSELLANGEADLGQLGKLKASINKEDKKISYIRLYYPAKLGRAIRNNARQLEDLIPSTKQITPLRAKGIRDSTRKLRNAFMRYLREGFVLGHNWEHPVTRVVYQHSQIKEAVELYRSVNPKDWLLFWLLWWPVSERAEFIAEQLDSNVYLVKRAWLKSVDSVLLLLTSGHLTPSGVKELLDSKLGSKKT